jgi:hypothetical protein
MSNYLVIMPNPIKGYSFDQTLFAINARDHGSLEGKSRFVLGVTPSGSCFHLNDYRYHKYPSDDANVLGAEAYELPLSVSPYMSQAGWFILYIPGKHLPTWQKDITEFLQKVSHETGVEHYEPTFTTAPLEPGRLNILELAEYPYGCSGGGHQTSYETREAAADEVDGSTEPNPPETETYTYIPSPYAVSSPLELLATIAKLCQEGKADAYTSYNRFVGVIAKDSILYSLDFTSCCHTSEPKMQLAEEQRQDITAALPLTPNSSPHMWLVFSGAPLTALPVIQAIYNDLRVSGAFEPVLAQDSPSVSADIAIYEPHNALYKTYKASRRDIPIHFYIPTAATPYNHLLFKGPAITKALTLSDFADLDTEEHEQLRDFYMTKAEETYRSGERFYD